MQSLSLKQSVFFNQPKPSLSRQRPLPQERKVADFKAQAPLQIQPNRQIQNDRLEKNEKAFSALLQRNAELPLHTRRSEFLQSEINSLSEIYKFINKEKIKDFILKNSYLLSLLKEFPTQIERYFGGNIKLALKISTEPDSSNSDELWILILTELSAKEAFPLLESLDENWWLDNLERANCKLNIRLEYI
jgi:hypothetical protein